MPTTQLQPTTRYPFRVNAEDDAAGASDGVSRYGAYLRQHIHKFDPWDEGRITVDPVDFADAAFEIATSPIMSPGYVAQHEPRIQEVRFSRDQEDGPLLAAVGLAVPQPSELAHHRLPGTWNGWHYDDQAHRYTEPEGYLLASQPTILTTTRVVYPLAPELLHTPAAELGDQSRSDTALQRGDLLTREAMASVARLVDLLNERLTLVLKLLDNPR